MERIPPSERIRREIDDLLRNGIRNDRFGGMLMRLGAQRLAQELLEAEQRDHLGRERYERRGEGAPPVHRNGYEPAAMKTAEGELALEVPQVRGGEEPYRSKLLAFLRGNSDVLERLAVEMYTRGLSTRDVEDALREATGDELLSKSAVSELTGRLWEEYEAFAARDLSGYACEYLLLDGLYEALRRHGRAKEGILCAWAILADGRKVPLHLALGNRESYEAWRDFLRDMVGRGLRAPTFIVSDGAPGLVRAIAEVFPKSLRGRCWFHRMANIVGKLPAEAVDEVKAHVRAVRDAPSYEAGRTLAAEVISRFADTYPAAMRSFEEDLEASLQQLRLPLAHRLSVRSTNLIERSFVEERRRTKVIPRFFDERSCIKLVFATLSIAAARWIAVRMGPLERAQLDHLRKQLGLDPHPAHLLVDFRGRERVA